MMKKANPAVIGGFVVGAVVLAILGILLLSSGQFLQEKLTYVLYFDGSIAGLQRGAPVNFRGVKLGTVARLKVELDLEDAQNSARTPVYIQVSPSNMEAVKIPIDSVSDAEEVMQLLVKRGLRASLQTQSFVTGLLSIELDFHPNTMPRLTGFDNDFPELPTIPSDVEQIMTTVTKAIKQIAKLPLEDMVHQFQDIVTNFDSVLKDVNVEKLSKLFEASLAEVKESGDSLNELLDALKRDVPPLAANLRATSAAARRVVEQDLTVALQELTKTLQESRPVIQKLNRRIGPLSESFESTTKTAEQVFVQAKGALASVEGTLSEDSSLRYDVAKTLDEIASAARAVRLLAEALERRPEVLIYGKGRARPR